MTIAQAFNEIAIAQGGTANTSGTIAGAIDALNDALAGSDQEAAQSIEAAVRLLGQHINAGGGGGGGEAQKYAIKCYTRADVLDPDVEVASFVCKAVFDDDDGYYTADTSGGNLTEAEAGAVLIGNGEVDEDGHVVTVVTSDTEPFPVDTTLAASSGVFVMPSCSVNVIEIGGR